MFRSDALNGRQMLLVRIIENNEINAYFRLGKVKVRIAMQCLERIMIGPRRVRASRKS